MLTKLAQMSNPAKWKILMTCVKLLLMFVMGYGYSLFLAAKLEEPHDLHRFAYSSLIFSYWLLVEIIWRKTINRQVFKLKLYYSIPIALLIFLAAISVFILWGIIIWTFLEPDGQFFINIALFIGEAPSIYIWQGVLLFTSFYLLSELEFVFQKVWMKKTGESSDEDAGIKTLTVQINGTMMIINVDEILRIEANNYYASIVIKEGSYLVRESMESLDSRLPPNGFFRIHRSHIVSIPAVKKIKRRNHNSSTAILHNGDEVPISRAKLKEFKGIISK